MKFENKNDSGVEKNLSEEECRKIIEGLGLHYVGIQERFKHIPPFVLFNSPDPRLQGTSMSVALHELTPENIKKKIKETLKIFEEEKSDEG